MKNSLFTGNDFVPLAERMRPASIEDYFGQRHLTDEGKIIREMLRKGTIISLILWGAPGCGKTTLARIIAEHLSYDSYFLSAVSAGVADVKRIIEIGKRNRDYNRKTLLFLDEIHRFNKAQQDSVLGAVESGDIILIGATTENPSFNVISPLLSRARIIKLNPLDESDLSKILERALETDEILKNKKIAVPDEIKEKMVQYASGDARRMLNLLEAAVSIAGESGITEEIFKTAVIEGSSYYDKKGERHYDTISAFIKSMRGSDPDAAVYYLARMINGGEDPVFIARRMVIFASEDVGNASPSAITIAVSAMTAVANIGMPEARIVLGQCAIFLASCPKSNASYLAIDKALAAAEDFSVEIPLHIRNAPTKLMAEMGYGKNYNYPHDFPGHFVKENYLPEKIKNERFYEPTEEGSEKDIKRRLRVLWGDRF